MARALLRGASCACQRCGLNASHLEGTAGWRRGYAADCKAPLVPRKINHIASKSYQDKPGTQGERDNAKSELIEDQFRIAWAIALREAIRECDPTDAALIMSDELERLRIGRPIPPLVNAMEEAVFWAGWATPFERKAYCLATFNAMSPKDQAGFLAYVTGRAAA